MTDDLEILPGDLASTKLSLSRRVNAPRSAARPRAKTRQEGAYCHHQIASLLAQG